MERIVDTLINLLGLAIWIRAVLPFRRTDSAEPEPPLRLILFASLFILLLLRGGILWGLASEIGPSIDFGGLVLSFSPDFRQQLVHSFGSFAVALFLFHLWCLGLSLCIPQGNRAGAVESAVCRFLGPVAGWHPALRITLSFLAGCILWIALGALLPALGIDFPWSLATILSQSPLIALSLWTSFLTLVLIVLLLHLVHSYCHLGGHPFWPFVDRTAALFLAPLRPVPLVVGRIDLAPFLGLIVYWILRRSGRDLIRWSLETWWPN